MLLLISVHNELSRLPFFCILSKQIRRFLLGAEHHNKRWLLICSRPSLLLSADRVPRQTGKPSRPGGLDFFTAFPKDFLDKKFQRYIITRRYV